MNSVVCPISIATSVKVSTPADDNDPVAGREHPLRGGKTVAHVAARRPTIRRERVNLRHALRSV